MPTQTSELSATLAQLAQKIDGILTRKGYPDLGFSVGNPSNALQDPEFVQAKQNALQVLEELQYLLLGPPGIILKQFVRQFSN